MHKIRLSIFAAIIIHIAMGLFSQFSPVVFSNIFFSALGFVMTFSVCYWQLALIDV